MRYSEIRETDESLESQLNLAKSHLKSARRYADSPGGNWQAADAVRNAYQAIKDIQTKIDQRDGKIKSVEFHIPEEDAKQLHSELHQLWKGTGVHPIPWQIISSRHDGLVIVTFNNYTPGEKRGGRPVEDLIAHVESYTDAQIGPDWD